MPDREFRKNGVTFFFNDFVQIFTVDLKVDGAVDERIFSMSFDIAHSIGLSDNFNVFQGGVCTYGLQYRLLRVQISLERILDMPKTRSKMVSDNLKSFDKMLIGIPKVIFHETA